MKLSFIGSLFNILRVVSEGIKSHVTIEEFIIALGDKEILLMIGKKVREAREKKHK